MYHVSTLSIFRRSPELGSAHDKLHVWNGVELNWLSSTKTVEFKFDIRLEPN